jgi:hypothetical protein
MLNDAKAVWDKLLIIVQQGVGGQDDAPFGVLTAGTGSSSWHRGAPASSSRTTSKTGR